MIPALRKFYGTPDYDYNGGNHRTCEKMYNSANEPSMSEVDVERFLFSPTYFRPTCAAEWNSRRRCRHEDIRFSAATAT